MSDPALQTRRSDQQQELTYRRGLAGIQTSKLRKGNEDVQTLLIGGNAGQGIDSTAGILVKLLKSTGYKVFKITDATSRIEGGHCFSVVGFGNERIFSADSSLDIIVAFDEETIVRHKDDLKPDGLILCDAAVAYEDRRIFRLNIPCMIGEAGLSHVEGCFVIGAVARLFQMRLDNLHHILRAYVLEQYQSANMKAAALGYDLVAKHLQKPHRPRKDLMIIAGITQAVSSKPKARFVRPVIKAEQFADLAQQR